MHRAWKVHFDHVRHSLVHAFYQGWDLHPAQLPTRYAAVYSFFLEGLDAAAKRLRGFTEKAAQATLLGDVFDDAATGQGLLNFFLRGLSCGAITPEEAAATGLTLEEMQDPLVPQDPRRTARARLKWIRPFTSGSTCSCAGSTWWRASCGSARPISSTASKGGWPRRGPRQDRPSPCGSSTPAASTSSTRTSRPRPCLPPCTGSSGSRPLTWLSGLLLLLLVYYAGGLLTSDPDVPFGRAALVGLASLVVAWFTYDLLCRSPLGRSEKAMAAAGFVLLLALAHGLLRVLSARAAWIHVGATMGTVMFLNVWELILPTQRRMIAAIAQGQRLDPALEDQAMLRTKHNTYLSVPLILVMLSNHFPTVSYGHTWSVGMLGCFLLLGFGAAHVLRRFS